MELNIKQSRGCAFWWQCHKINIYIIKIFVRGKKFISVYNDLASELRFILIAFYGKYSTLCIQVMSNQIPFFYLNFLIKSKN